MATPTRPAGKSRRLGKSGDDIFVPIVEGTDATRPKKRGRRPSHTEHWTKVTVVLFDRQIVFLDRLGADIRAASGVAISRAHVIRALIDALSESDLAGAPVATRDWSGVVGMIRRTRLRPEAHEQPVESRRSDQPARNRPRSGP